MGIPTFFRQVLEKNPHIIEGLDTSHLYDFDYFFIDFNAVIYTVLTKHKSPRDLIDRVVDTIVSWTVDIIRPREYVYIAMDGSAPRAKMVQQRSRRYKSLLLKKHFPDSSSDWDTSNISPGTRFMWDLKTAIEKAMIQKRFGSNRRVLLSDTTCPGEGEHKFLHRIRSMDRDKRLVIFSPDNDMISLGLLTKKSKIHLMRFVDPNSDLEKHVHNYELFVCDLDRLRTIFETQMTQLYSDLYDPDRILLDYNFLLSLVGNDFVPSLPFLKIRSGGLRLLLHIYNELRSVHRSYLIHENLDIHFDFLADIFQKLACIETHEMKKQYAQMDRDFHGQTKTYENPSLSEDELRKSRFLHLSLFHPDNPLFPIYGHLYCTIDYSKPKHEWKASYYRYFCGFDSPDTYNRDRTRMVHNYLESLLFTLHYYNQKCPSWSWYYRYRVAPIPSDVWTVLMKDRRLPRVPLSLHPCLHPFEQLMLILPPSTIRTLLPSQYHSIIKENDKYFVDADFVHIDALAGGKFIYSEALLPEMDDIDRFITRIRSVHLDHVIDKKRNQVSKSIRVFSPFN